MDEAEEVHRELDEYEPGDLLGLGSDIERNLAAGKTPGEVIDDLARMGFQRNTATWLVDRVIAAEEI